jgi:LmbE family N-acetylglucosaminyl deacetylase
MLFDFENADNGQGVLIVFAHPDDEVIGLGAQLSSLRQAQLITVTDGSPLDLGDARNAGCCTRVGYAALRRKEQQEAWALAGLPSGNCVVLDYIDQRAAFSLETLSHQIATLIDRWRIHTVFTHPFEAGHPDHDATCFAVHAAVHLLTQQKPVIYEFASYHLSAGNLVTGRFRGTGTDEWSIALTEDQQRFKRQLIECHWSQRQTLSIFRTEEERFRLAPEYDFRHAPVERWYEHFPWGMTGVLWNGLAAEAWHALSEPSIVCP